MLRQALFTALGLCIIQAFASTPPIAKSRYFFTKSPLILKPLPPVTAGTAMEYEISFAQLSKSRLSQLSFELHPGKPEALVSRYQTNTLQYLSLTKSKTQTIGCYSQYVCYFYHLTPIEYNTKLKHKTFYLGPNLSFNYHGISHTLDIKLNYTNPLNLNPIKLKKMTVYKSIKVLPKQTVFITYPDKIIKKGKKGFYSKKVYTVLSITPTINWNYHRALYEKAHFAKEIMHTQQEKT